MLFEEFFKKKKINLTALQQGEPDLFSEFKEHYEQMGEKSFDHTKKYWFNKLRRLYPPPPEVKAEKPHMENQVAEQTITDTLTEPSPRDAAPNLGFKPKFKAGTTTPPKPASETPVEDTPTAPSPEKAAESNVASVAPTPKLGFKPKFRTAPAKPAEEQPIQASEQETASTPAPENGQAAEAQPAAKPAYKPRFQAKNIAPKPAAEPTTPAEAENVAQVAEVPVTESKTENTDSGNSSAEITPEPTPKLGFKPRFKAAALPGVIEQSKDEETTAPESVQQQPNSASEPAPPAQRPETIEPKSVQENTGNDAPAPSEAEAPAAKPVYKPRFNPKMIKPKPPEQD